MCRNAWFLKSCSEHTIYIIYRVAYNGWDCKDNLKLNLNIQPYCAQWRHIQCKYVRPELGTLVLCISRSMLDLLVINLFFNRTQSGVQDSFGQRLKGILIIDPQTKSDPSGYRDQTMSIQHKSFELSTQYLEKFLMRDFFYYTNVWLHLPN